MLKAFRFVAICLFVPKDSADVWAHQGFAADALLEHTRAFRPALPADAFSQDGPSTVG